LLLSLTALWGFAAFVTLREGLNVLWVSSLDSGVGRPTESLVAALQTERRLSAVYHASTADRSGQRQALLDQRKQTDKAITAFNEQAGTSSVSWAASGTLKLRIRDLSTLLGRLPGQRETLDAGKAGSVSGVAGGYTEIIDAAFRVYGSISALDDPEIAKQSATLIALSRARETLSQEDALLSGVLAAGRFSGGEQIEFTQLVGVQRYAYAQASADLPSPEREQYERLIAGETLTRLRALEDRVIANARAGAPAPVAAAEWTTSINPVADELRQLELTSADLTLGRATPAVIGVIVRLALAGGLGLLAVIASIIMSITTARSLLGQLVRLRDAADDLATKRLPAVMERLRRGETVDVLTEAPPLQFGNDEIGQVGQAFNAVQESAVRAAVEQAELRKSVNDVFAGIARRTQTLVHRQLSTLDKMERKETNPATLAELFDVDHLGTRMRRNAENVIVLSGGVAGRAWRRPVPMIDVVRAAVAEIEDYARVNVLPLATAGLAGRAVGDAIHLLAELIENAAVFSPPHTAVQVTGQIVSNGFVVEIEDRGLGMKPDALEHANAQVQNPPEFLLSSKIRLGLYVVGKLSERHGIRVQLRTSPYGGTTAIVLIPTALIVSDSTEPVSPEATTTNDGAAANGAGGAAAPANGKLEPQLAVAMAPAANGAAPQTATLTTPPVAGKPVAQEPRSGSILGLPQRARRRPHAAAATTARPADQADGGAPQPGTPQPEEMRRVMRSFQSGLERARPQSNPPSVQPQQTDAPVIAAPASTAPDEQP
jgi:signal transduction histidine kinase